MRKPEIGRKSILKAIQKTKDQKINEVTKTANIALEYYYWSLFEFRIDNFSMADSLLSVAEDMVILGDDAWRYAQFPVVQQVKASREYLNGFLKDKRPSYGLDEKGRTDLPPSSLPTGE